MTVAPNLYGRHRKWAIDLAGKDATDEDRIVALVTLWDAAREWDADGRGFREHVRPLIVEAVAREREGV